MPDLNQLPVPEYQPGQPYHWSYDNLPLKALAERDEIINFEVDNHGNILRSCAGTQGTLANRLNQSIDEDGNLIPAAVDQALHNIAEHTDGFKTVTTPELEAYQALGFPSLTNPVEFARMLSVERDKLANVADNATNITVSVETDVTTVNFTDGNIELVASPSIEWSVESPNKVQAILKVSTDFAHRHFYEQIPVPDTLLPNKKFYITSVSVMTPVVEDSLRVYINGTRLNTMSSIPYPNNNATEYKFNKFTVSYEENSFTLDNSIEETDVILIDFDISLT